MTPVTNDPPPPTYFVISQSRGPRGDLDFSGGLLSNSTWIPHNSRLSLYVHCHWHAVVCFLLLKKCTLAQVLKPEEHVWQWNNKMTVSQIRQLTSLSVRGPRVDLDFSGGLLSKSTWISFSDPGGPEQAARHCPVVPSWTNVLLIPAQAVPHLRQRLLYVKDVPQMQGGSWKHLLNSGTFVNELICVTRSRSRSIYLQPNFTHTLTTLLTYLCSFYQHTTRTSIKKRFS